MVRLLWPFLAVVIALGTWSVTLPYTTSEEVYIHESTDPELVVDADQATSSPSAFPITNEVLSDSEDVYATSTAKATENAEEKGPVEEPQTQPPPNTQDTVYATTPLTVDELNNRARVSLVNILCLAQAPLRSTSGSGVFIDSQGTILTNAHIAQYVLLAAHTDLPIECEIRTGAPARTKWTPGILYIPPQWIKEHADDVLSSRPLGTGEHDYALLNIREGPIEDIVELPFDTRHGAITGVSALAAGYPAEFGGTNQARNGLYPSTAMVPLGQFFTFTDNVVDAFSLGSNPVAQGGSSGGPVLNRWGYLIGIITTTTEGPTTADRDLRAITIAHVNRGLLKDLGVNLEEFIRTQTSLSVELAITNAQSAALLTSALGQQN